MWNQSTAKANASAAARLLAVVIIRLVVQAASLPALEDCFAIAADLLACAPQDTKLFLMRVMFSAIANNFDYTRKDACMTFYYSKFMELLKEETKSQTIVASL